MEEGRRKRKEDQEKTAGKSRGEEEEERRRRGGGEEEERRRKKGATFSAMFVHVQVSISPSTPPPILLTLPPLTSISHDFNPDTRASSEEEPWSSQHCPAEQVKIDHQTDEEEREDLCVYVCVCVGWGVSETICLVL